jgi:Domain of unknown function (DUF4402)
MIKSPLSSSAQFFLGFAVMIAVMIGAGQAQATPVVASTTVEVSALRLIQMTPIDDLEFGKIVKPSAGVTKFRLDRQGGSMQASGGDGVYLSGAQIGSMNIRGTIGEIYYLQANGATCDDPNMEFADVAFSGRTGPAGNFVFTRLSGNTVYYGGTLSVGSRTVPGQRTCTVTVTASY